MGNRPKNEEKDSMKCRVCGSTLESMTTDLPFKVTERTIVILKSLPVVQCKRCSEYLIEDSIFAKVEELLAKVDTSVELEIIAFAA
jgi:YgiT-type zinc finger domain-containing protein